MSTFTRQTLSYFETLPTELIIQILSALTKLNDLDSVLHASPTAYRVFDAYAAKITQTILESGYVYQGWRICRRLRRCGDTSPNIRVLILLMILVRSSRLPTRTLADFSTAVDAILHINAYNNKFQDHPLWNGKPKPPGTRRSGFDPEPIPGDTPPAVIRSVLATSRRTTWLTWDCLHLYLARFRQLRPAHPAEKKKSFRNQPESYRKNFLLEPWNSKPPCRWPKVVDLGPPTAKEETCVARVLWLLQLRGDIKKATACSKLDWPVEDTEAFEWGEECIALRTSWPWATSSRTDVSGSASGASRGCVWPGSSPTGGLLASMGTSPITAPG
ncbi:hypothetical protein PG984_007518 [Apiospora sp. TS-2023a]